MTGSRTSVKKSSLRKRLHTSFLSSLKHHRLLHSSLFCLLVSSSLFIGIRFMSTDQIEELQSKGADIAISAVAPFQQASKKLSQLRSYATTQEDNHTLRQLNDFLAHENKRLQHENAYLKESLKFKNQPLQLVLSTEPRYFSSSLDHNFFYIEKSSKHPVAPGQIVLSKGKLLGRITSIGDHHAKVMTIYAAQSRVPVRLIPSNQQALLTGDSTPNLQLSRFSEESSPPASSPTTEKIVTSGTGGIFPAGVPVGAVHFNPKTGKHTVEDTVDTATLNMLHVVKKGDGS